MQIPMLVSSDKDSTNFPWFPTKGLGPSIHVHTAGYQLGLWVLARLSWKCRASLTDRGGTQTQKVWKLYVFRLGKLTFPLLILKSNAFRFILEAVQFMSLLKVHRFVFSWSWLLLVILSVRSMLSHPRTNLLDQYLLVLGKQLADSGTLSEAGTLRYALSFLPLKCICTPMRTWKLSLARQSFSCLPSPSSQFPLRRVGYWCKTLY